MITKKSSCNTAKLKILLLVTGVVTLFVFLSCNKTGPACPRETSKKAAFSAYDMMPEFPGGSVAMIDFISKNIKYPESAKISRKQGKVFVSFTVDKKGKVKNTSIQKGVCPELDAEALRVVKLMPTWKPGTQDDINLTLPINFKLAEVILPQIRLDC